ncbi:single-stranded DNA-binding protein [Vagococcus zengguangii]|uniref:Single-stranded DNA-binding protein n=1 Tax=Vagococcus zengguangii TaxID=2571750 RepID=A0A4D7CSA9_9ENTE|nr:single-stranded DNA-binding protein [Vagococcus zengguangii]QCI85450.1 single-stranded DNA-binding protein [Vagococcus zengguangii]TLG79995.1 single-stranded DNA-binding protein [Vagococcus zengguangii]
MINNVVLVGRLTKDPDLRYTSSGQATANFTLAVNRSYKNANGQYDADFINVVIWRKPAETLAQYAKKGTLLGVTGRIQTRNYENQQGQRVYVTEVVCENFQLLESRASSERRQTNDQSFGGGGFNGGQSFNQSFNQSSTQASQNSMPDFSRDADPFASSAQIDISDDDLPF